MKLAQIETITNLTPIEGADRIELATIQGWQSVVKKGQFSVGEKIIFIPIDTVLEPRDWNQFLWDKKNPSEPIRIKTIKLRGTISQGLVFPFSILENKTDLSSPNLEESLPMLLGISKYEKPIPVHLRGTIKGNFSSHIISKTDEDNLKSNIKCLEELKNCYAVQISLKIDGTSATYIKDFSGEFKVFSRNYEMGEDENNVYWKVANLYKLKELMRNGTSIQGEIAGPNVQGNPAGYSNLQLFAFNFKDLTSQRYVNILSKKREFEMYVKDIQTVPLISTILKSSFQYETLESLQEFANKQLYPNGEPAEGIVIRGLNENDEYVYSNTLQKMLSVKVINQNFKD